MADKQAIIRQAKNALHLILTGAIEKISTSCQTGEDYTDHLIELFDSITAELDDWEVKGSRLDNMENLIANLQTMQALIPVLSNYNLLP